MIIKIMSIWQIFPNSSQWCN